MFRPIFKDTFREIRKTFGRFIAILVIVALGTAFFVGCRITCPDMKKTADQYFKDNHFMDFKVVSTIGFNKNDVDYLKKLNDIKEVMPSYSVDAVANVNGKDKVFRISSLQDSEITNHSINRPYLVDGRLPLKTGECVIEKNKIMDVDFHVGDHIALSSGTDKKLSASMETSDYIVVGIVSSPLYISKDRGTTIIGNGQISAFMQVKDTDFKLKYYNSVYMTLKDDICQSYSAAYDDRINAIKDEIEDYSNQGAKRRYNDMKEDAQSTLNQKKKNYKKALKDTKIKLDNAIRKIDQGQAEIDNGNQQIAYQRTVLESKGAASQKKIDEGKQKLENANKKYKKNLSDFLALKQQAIDSGLYILQKPAFDQKEAQLNGVKKTIEKNRSELIQNQKKLNNSIAKAKQTITSKQRELETGKREIEAARIKYTANKKSAFEKLDKVHVRLVNARKDIDQIDEVKWYVFDRNDNVGYVEFGSAADRMEAISQVFPILFILVAILICLAGMGRMVEEQRGFIGTLKALGYSKGVIALKFLVYAVIASILGSIAGLAVGTVVFPGVIFKAYSILYNVPSLIHIVDIPLSIASILVALIVTVGSALTVCLGELNANAAKLMRPRAPKPSKTILLERVRFLWKRLTFTQKATARNIFRYKSRFLMTVIGVGGCTALLLVGFGLNDCISTINDKQFGEIYTYQTSVYLKDDISPEAFSRVRKLIEKQDGYQSMQLLHAKTANAGYRGKEKSCNIVVPQKPQKINEYITLRAREGGAAIPLTDQGAVITEKLAGMMGVSVGDMIYIKDGDTGKIDVKVAGICENYLMNFIYLTPVLYKNMYGETPFYNQINIKSDKSDSKANDAFYKKAIDADKVASIGFIADNKAKFSDIIKSIYNIILVLIVSAGLLSFIVLYTLTNINVNERIREIATIKVLGFFDREVSSYVFRENIILTLIGSCFGMLLGLPLAQYVIGTAEVDTVMFGRQIYFRSYVIAVIITVLFSLTVNMVMLRKIKKIDMVEALKTIE